MLTRKLFFLTFTISLYFSALQTNAQYIPDSVKHLVFEQTFKKGNQTKVKLLILIEHGYLVIDGNNRQLANVKFDYFDRIWSPVASYIEEEQSGKLVIKANASLPITDDKLKNHCNINLNNEQEYQLAIELGAGTADINLNEYNITKALFRLGAGKFNINLSQTPVQSLKLDAGAGEIFLDLSGKRINPLNADIHAGVGQITIVVPKDYPVSFNIKGLLGKVDAENFSKSGTNYSSNTGNANLPMLDFAITGGIGNIVIRQK